VKIGINVYRDHLFFLYADCTMGSARIMMELHGLYR
jgi:hypothetical protein